MSKYKLSALLLCLITLLASCSNQTDNSKKLSANKKEKKKPKGKQTPAPELTKMDGQQAVAFSIGLNTITTYFPIAFYEDLMRNRTAKDSEQKTGNPQAYLNQFSSVRNLRGPEYKLIATPNNDTYYAQAYCDVSKEPIVFHIPKMENNRYYVFQVWDPNGDTFSYLGSRTIGSNGGEFAFVGPDFKGEIPKNVKVVKTQYNNFVIWGRIGVLQGKNDAEKVHAIQDKLAITYLSDFKSGKKTPAFNEEASLKRLNLELPENLPEGLEWYYKIAIALQHTPSGSKDAPLLESMEYIGYSSNGTEFNFDKLTARQITGMKKASQYAFHMMDIVAQSVGEEVNGWRWSSKSGILGNDYLFRAAWARWYTGGNSAEEAIYMDGRKDNEGNPFSSTKKYTMHFDKDKLPRVKAFWSVSMYNLSDGSFTENEINRYSIGSNTQGLTYNDDGSLDLYIQSTKPESESKISNWLPSPKEGGFYMDLRLYNPDDSLQKGTWKPPYVMAVE